jgi:hypothetical protein
MTTPLIRNYPEHWGFGACTHALLTKRARADRILLTKRGQRLPAGQATRAHGSPGKEKPATATAVTLALH